MGLRSSISILLISLILVSCWGYYNRTDDDGFVSGPKVWGFKPVYAVENIAKTILYTATPRAVVNPGNIYAYQNYILQIDAGTGIHVIDNTVPSAATRVGFITVRGCSQVSVKDNKLYTNSYDDLVVIDCSNLNNVHEYSRLRGVFTEYRYESPLAQPPASGYYQCPVYDSLVTGWVRDSVYQQCYKN
jgi:hypothetical protein